MSRERVTVVRRVFHARLGGVTVAGGRAGVLAHLLGAGLDEQRLELHCWSRTSSDEHGRFLGRLASFSVWTEAQTYVSGTATTAT